MDSRTLGNVSNVAHSYKHRDEVLIVKREKKLGEHQANTNSLNSASVPSCGTRQITSKLVSISATQIYKIRIAESSPTSSRKEWKTRTHI